MGLKNKLPKYLSIKEYTKYPLIKEYTLNYKGLHSMIYDLIPSFKGELGSLGCEQAAKISLHAFRSRAIDLPSVQGEKRPQVLPARVV